MQNRDITTVVAEAGERTVMLERVEAGKKFTVYYEDDTTTIVDLISKRVVPVSRKHIGKALINLDLFEDANKSGDKNIVLKPKNRAVEFCAITKAGKYRILRDRENDFLEEYGTIIGKETIRLKELEKNRAKVSGIFIKYWAEGKGMIDDIAEAIGNGTIPKNEDAVLTAIHNRVMENHAERRRG